jgi:prolyl oligopeptidase PreP (S9A serine peptidase family)
VRCWQRGTPFEEAPVVFECERTEMVAWGWREHSPSRPRTCFIRRPEFFHNVFYIGDGSGVRRQVDIPTAAYLFIERNWLILNLRSDGAVAGQRYKAGALLVIDAFNLALSFAFLRETIASEVASPGPPCQRRYALDGVLCAQTQSRRRCRRRDMAGLRGGPRAEV